MSTGWWARLWHPRRTRVAANARCPECHEPVIIAGEVMQGSRLGGPMFSPRTRGELVAACATHGRSPFNERTIDLREQRGS